MKKLSLFTTMMALIFYSCQKEIHQAENEVQPVSKVKPICGTTEAMEKMDPEMKAELMNSTYQTDVIVPNIVLYLDFDGGIIVPGFGGHDRSPIISSVRNCPPAPLTDQQRSEVVEHVSDFYSPFNITVTEDLNVFLSTSPGLRHVCVITTSPTVLGMSAGIVGASPFNCSRIFNSPCFVFAQFLSTQTKYIGGIIAHEVGHMFSLDHQSLYNEECQSLAEYRPRFGSGSIAFTPLMGDVSNTGINNWFTQNCAKMPCRPGGQDDFSIISSLVELKPDDFPNDASGNDAITEGPVNGILEMQNDVDYLLINFRSPGSVTINSENIDIKASLLSPGGHVLAVYNDPNSTGVVIPSASGRRFLRIEGASNSNLSSQFMTGKYKVQF